MSEENWELSVPSTKIERCIEAFEGDFLDIVKRVKHFLKEVQSLEDDMVVNQVLPDSASEGLVDFLDCLNGISEKDFCWDDWKHGKSGYKKFIRAAMKSKKIDLIDGPVKK